MLEFHRTPPAGAILLTAAGGLAHYGHVKAGLGPAVVAPAILLILPALTRALLREK
jgi:hypothetical protein